MRAILALLFCCLSLPVWAQAQSGDTGNVAEERDYSEYVEAFSSAQMGNCTQACGTTLANCQASGNLRCQRGYDSCMDECAHPKKSAAKLSKQEYRQQICRQRCDYSSNACTESRPNDPDACERGRMQCYERCMP